MDGGVENAENQECTSAAADHLYIGADPDHASAFLACDGRLVCSYSAECVALFESLRQFLPLIPAGSSELVASDS